MENEKWKMENGGFKLEVQQRLNRRIQQILLSAFLLIPQ